MVKSQASGAANRHSGRLGLDNRVLDETTRRQRIKKHLDALEKDNVHDDPHANLVWNKAAPKFTDELVYSDANRKRKALADALAANGDSATKKGRKLRAELAKTRFRKTFNQLVEEEEQRVQTEEPGVLTYAQIRAPPSRLPPRKFCAVCGVFSKYSCVRCAARFCSMRCRDVHVDTRSTHLYSDDVYVGHPEQMQRSSGFVVDFQRMAKTVPTMERSTDEVYGEIISHAVASVCQDAGFSSVGSAVLLVLSRMTSNFFDEICETSKRMCEHSGRTHIMLRDAQLAFELNGIVISEFCNMLRYVRCNPNSVLPEVATISAPIIQSSLRVGEPRPHPTHMPSFLPPFPDPHTYIHTEISGEVDSDYEKVRRLTARNKRNTESSLISYVLATRPSTSLFRDYERHLTEEAREVLKRARQIKQRNLEARRNARSAQRLSRELANTSDVLMNNLLQDDTMDTKKSEHQEEEDDEKTLLEEELFESNDTEHSYVRRHIPDYCRILLPFDEPRPYLSAMVTEENLDDDANHYAKILSKEIEDELADVTDDFES